MKKVRKAFIIEVLFLLIWLLMGNRSYANNLIEGCSLPEYTENFKNYLQLTEEEQKEMIQPRMFQIEQTNVRTKNPLKLIKSARSTMENKFSLKDVIDNNVVVKNQGKTNSCWTFAALSSLETNLALIGNDTSKVYDFSERHMEYATSRFFANDAINPKGFDRNAGDGGNWSMAIAYLTNGMGAVKETAMPFEDNENKINISEIQNQTVASQVYDTVAFPSYSSTEDTTQLRQQMKEHIKNYSSIFAYIHGATLFSEYYNNETGAIYCDDATKCPTNHGVSIIGWDDDYPVENFNQEHRPTNKGAWIIKNSWGEKIEYRLTQMKEVMFEAYTNECIANGWQQASAIPDEKAKEFFEKNGYTIDSNGAFLKVGDNGFMYVSYEDINIYSNLFGIEKSSDSIDYENIYQYDDFGDPYYINYNASKIYVGNVFHQQTTRKEYLTQVALLAPEAYTCSVYVNAKGSSMSANDLELIPLKAGTTESFNAGYHTLEFAKPLEITSDSFAVVIEIQGTRNDQVSFSTEVNIPKSMIANSPYDLVEIENGKCFFTSEESFQENVWQDLSKMSQASNQKFMDADSSIKAFTVSQVEDDPTTPGEDSNPKEDKAENSNFDQARCEIKGIETKASTDDPENSYLAMHLEITGITRNTNNDKCEYYYYLSPNQVEDAIEDWIPIHEEQTAKDKLIFTINTNDVKNEKEVFNSNTLYLYIKEIATKGSDQSEAISKSILLYSNDIVEDFVDHTKQDGMTTDKNYTKDHTTISAKDTTLATKMLPNTGMKAIVISIVVITIIAMGIYIRYKILSKYVK